MSLTHFCSTCAAKISYETAKPAVCPKCRNPIRDAAALLSQATAAPQSVPTPRVTQPTEAYHDNGAPLDDAPYRQPVRSERSQPIVRKERKPARATAKLYEGEEEGDRMLDGGGEQYDRREAKRLAQEWAAAFEGEGIELGGLKAHETITFGTLWKQGEDDRTKGAS